ncbi:MAG TPA: SRPBCC domain-containing protein [Candidatus Elarobacter sp.]
MMTWTMRVLFVAALAFGATVFPASAHARSFDVGHVHVTTTDAPKRLDMAVTVPATVDQVWDAFTTPAGLTTWLAPFAKVELAVGGPWQVSFTADGAAAGGNVLLFQPKSLLALSAMAPAQFPTVRRERTTAVFLFDAAGANATTVRLAQTGWKPGDEWDKAFDDLATGNAQLLEALYHRFAVGPEAWK